MARKILLADDSVTAQNMGRKILADAGYEVIAVNNGSAALKKIAELKPDLVILDVYMPGYSGLEVCQRLKESQETARIPVLLSVGKLEPFKPEEAQRVRADGFIVKPFEASELLSALSKLEDKVVPRAEPSKPGRFARAIAAAEESGRGSQNEATGNDNGWKSRIGFPHKKTEAEEKAAEEAPIYNPMNRDLRTVVETPLEKAAEKIFKTQTEEKRLEADKAVEPHVDVAAVATAGLPKDVTPEEVAAISAAAAQMLMGGALGKDERQQAKASEVTSQANLEPAPERVDAVLPSPAVVAEADHRRNGDERPEETQDVPVTMAATAESVAAASAGGSRWRAVPVALEGEETTISLDQEMQKAYAAFVAAEANSAAVAAAPEVVAASAANSSVPAEAPVAAISNPEPEPVPEPELARTIEPTEAVAAPVAQSEAATVAPAFAATDLAANDFAAAGFASTAPASLPEPERLSSAPSEASAPEPVRAEVAAPAESSATPEFAEPIQGTGSVAEFVSRIADAEIEDSATPARQELRPAPESGPAVEPKLDPETVKNTAAAWASWRQTRDTGNGSDALEPQPKEKEIDIPEPPPAETAARAVAAGAEQILQEASAAAPSGDSRDVASIVDSVLADLRPKLMEEISRKMSEKK